LFFAKKEREKFESWIFFQKNVKLSSG